MRGADEECGWNADSASPGNSAFLIRTPHRPEIPHSSSALRIVPSSQLLAARSSDHKSAAMFGRYLFVREGLQFIGALVDAQIQGRNPTDIFAAPQMVPSNLERPDIEFHRWVIDRAAHGR